MKNTKTVAEQCKDIWPGDWQFSTVRIAGAYLTTPLFHVVVEATASGFTACIKSQGHVCNIGAKPTLRAVLESCRAEMDKLLQKGLPVLTTEKMFEQQVINGLNEELVPAGWLRFYSSGAWKCPTQPWIVEYRCDSGTGIWLRLYGGGEHLGGVYMEPGDLVAQKLDELWAKHVPARPRAVLPPRSDDAFSVLAAKVTYCLTSIAWDLVDATEVSARWRRCGDPAWTIECRKESGALYGTLVLLRGDMVVKSQGLYCGDSVSVTLDSFMVAMQRHASNSITK